MFRAAAILFTLIVSCTTVQATEWNGLFIAGDNSIEAFDNSQQALTEIFTGMGLATSATRFTATQSVAKKNREIKLLSMDRLSEVASHALAGEGQGCLIHLSSHGSEDYGVYLAMDGGTYLEPAHLVELLDAVCGDRPTVVLVSACYSGQFITDAIKGPNRIILTAARADRPSFGCSASDIYTYWDGCLIDELPRSKTWWRLYDNVSACIGAKEATIDDALPSLPQAWFGENTRGWRILN